MQSIKTQKSQAFLLKGGAYTLTTIQLNTLDFEDILAALADKIAQAPKFFEKIPLVLDLQKIQQVCQESDLSTLITHLRKNHLIPIGVRGANETLQKTALEHGLACLPDLKGNNDSNKSQTIEAANLQEKISQANATTKVITQPVRSGQQIYAPGGDLIVLATVSHGAEILADGNIHVYAPLRGRALAGVMGDQNAYIFCQSLEAELISIAGHYRISEQLKESGWQQSVQVALADKHLKITPLHKT